MRTIAILPIKSFGAAKQRLASLLGGGSRQALARAMFADVLTSLRHVPQIDAIAVVTANRDAQDVARGERVLLLRDDREDGQSAAVGIGIRHAVAEGYERALLVPGDTPLLDPVEVGALLTRAQDESTAVAIVPDRHGTGTNALLLAPPEAMEPSFGPDSLDRHRTAALATGRSHRVEAIASLMLDVDTPEDLADLAQALEEQRGRAPTTRGLLRQLDRSEIGGATAARRRRQARAAPAARVEA